jgi:hypothetical protein
MATHVRRVERSRNQRRAPLAKAALLALLFFPHALAQAQERRAATPAPSIPGKTAANPPATGIITLGTSKEKVDLLLGSPKSGSIIPCLNRSMYSYGGGTLISFAGTRVISAIPGGLAEGNPGQGYTIEYQGRQVLIDPIVLDGACIEGPLGELKREIEERPFFAAPLHTTGNCAPPPYQPPCLHFPPIK